MLTTLTSSGRWCNSVRLRDPGRIFPPKPGNGFSSSTEDYSRLLDGILVDLWAFKVCYVIITGTDKSRICLFEQLKVQTDIARVTNHKNAVRLQKASTTKFISFVRTEANHKLYTYIYKGITISHFTNCAKPSSSIYLVKASVGFEISVKLMQMHSVPLTHLCCQFRYRIYIVYLALSAINIYSTRVYEKEKHYTGSYFLSHEIY